MNKAYIKIQGGLGNQLHGYAFGKAIEKHHNVEVIYDIYTGYVNDSFNRNFNLNIFPNIKLGNPIKYRNKSNLILFKVFFKLMQNINFILPLKYQIFIVEPSPYRFQLNILETDFFFNTYFVGYWATYKYYNLIRDKLILELKPLKSNTKIENYYLDLISKSNSCFLHYRTYKEDITVKHETLYLYYINAIKYIKSKYSDIKIFVFSDDIQIAKNNLNTISNDFIFIENTNDNTDFFLMNQCYHSIIADSTFSWWAAWLSDNVNKTVIAPKNLSPWGVDWAPESWILINVK